MKKYNRIVAYLCFFLTFPSLASASSLDELYRDIVKSDNQGYLPMFVKNRAIPDILVEEELLKKLEKTPPHQLKQPIPDPVYLSDDRQKREDALRAAAIKWNNTILAVQENRVTPYELEEITLRANNNDPKAVEILAWMNARGIGLKPNLIEAFKLYQKAISLQVPQATENALRVYRSMTAEQRKLLGDFQN